MERRHNVILLDVEEPYASALASAARDRGLAALRTGGPPAAPWNGRAPRLVVVQECADGLACHETLRALRKTCPEAPCVVLRRGARLPGAAVLLEAGARDIVDLGAHPAEVAEACLHHALCEDSDATGDLVGRSPAMHNLRRAVAAAARVPATVLLTGETGTGKGVTAQVLHRLSPRSGQPLVHVDCAALAPTVIESELFGHERGAFTGAASARVGRFEQAGRGTIFLDEIGELSSELQAKFLRVLEERGFERVGGTTTHRMPARVVAATNRDLEAEVAAGRFRRDLLYRLRVMHLTMPPLRDRLDDMPLLVEAGLARACEQLDRPVPAVGPGFCERLCEHDWPGNVRELVHVLEAVLVRTRSPRLEAFHLEGVLPDGDPPAGPGRPGEEPCVAPPAGPPEAPWSERERLAELLMATGGNVARAARRAGMARSTLRYKIRRYELAHLIPTD